MKAILLATVMVCGCINSGCRQPTDAETEIDEEARKASVSYLCIGMEKSSRFGDCPGCEIDAKRISSLLGNTYGYKGETLISGNATKSAVVEKLKKGIENTPANGLFLFCYSGHGGQEYLGGKEPDGADRKDEYLCLYDSHMLDDEIWDIVSKCNGRVFMYFDACHSATMYRSVKDVTKFKKNVGRSMSVKSEDMVSSKGFTFRPERFITAQSMGSDDSKNSPRILCWSGCKEAEYSYGGNSGGVMTCSLIKNWRKGMKYSELWTKVFNDVKKAQPGQNPVQSYIGSFPKNIEAFK